MIIIDRKTYNFLKDHQPVNDYLKRQGIVQLNFFNIVDKDTGKKVAHKAYMDENGGIFINSGTFGQIKREYVYPSTGENEMDYTDMPFFQIDDKTPCGRTTVEKIKELVSNACLSLAFKLTDINYDKEKDILSIHVESIPTSKVHRFSTNNLDELKKGLMDLNCSYFEEDKMLKSETINCAYLDNCEDYREDRDAYLLFTCADKEKFEECFLMCEKMLQKKSKDFFLNNFPDVTEDIIDLENFKLIKSTTKNIL